jgi:type IV pilus assembly protein PilW
MSKLGGINCHSQAAGFTLVELMLAMAVGGIVMGAVMTSFLSQHRSYLVQDEVVEMQQNARVALELLTRDIRSAGYDPNNLGADITVAGGNNLVFTRDDGAGALEAINYTLVDAYVTEGRNDGVVDDLGRDEGGGLQPVAENIEQLEFRYLDEDGNVTANLADIRALQISILAVARRPDQNFTNTMVYCPASNPFNPLTGLCTNPAPATIWGPFNDNLRRRLLITTVQCRNLGL